MRYIIFFISIIFFTNSCTAMSVPPTPSSSSVIEIRLFDGTEFSKIIKKDKGSPLNHNITKRLYGLFFITKTGFHPEYIFFRSTEEPIELNTVPLDRIKDNASGILTGVVYSSVSGGKIKEFRGISKVFRGEKIDIINGRNFFSAITNEEGIYEIALPEGEYFVRFKGKEIGKVSIEPEKTSFKNILIGITVVD